MNSATRIRHVTLVTTLAFGGIYFCGVKSEKNNLWIL